MGERQEAPLGGSGAGLANRMSGARLWGLLFAVCMLATAMTEGVQTESQTETQAHSGYGISSQVSGILGNSRRRAPQMYAGFASIQVNPNCSPSILKPASGRRRAAQDSCPTGVTMSCENAHLGGTRPNGEPNELQGVVGSFVGIGDGRRRRNSGSVKGLALTATAHGVTIKGCAWLCLCSACNAGVHPKPTCHITKDGKQVPIYLAGRFEAETSGLPSSLTDAQYNAVMDEMRKQYVDKYEPHRDCNLKTGEGICMQAAGAGGPSAGQLKEANAVQAAGRLKESNAAQAQNKASWSDPNSCSFYKVMDPAKYKADTSDGFVDYLLGFPNRQQNLRNMLTAQMSTLKQLIESNLSQEGPSNTRCTNIQTNVKPMVEAHKISTHEGSCSSALSGAKGFVVTIEATADQCIEDNHKPSVKGIFAVHRKTGTRRAKKAEKKALGEISRVADVSTTGWGSRRRRRRRTARRRRTERRRRTARRRRSAPPPPPVPVLRGHTEITRPTTEHNNQNFSTMAQMHSGLCSSGMALNACNAECCSKRKNKQALQRAMSAKADIVLRHALANFRFEMMKKQ